MTSVQRWLAIGVASIATVTGGVLISAKEAPAAPPNVYFATVTDKGVLAPNRNGVIGAQNYGGPGATPGEYYVIFTNPIHVNTCALSVTMASESSGEVTVQSGGAINRVNVNTFDSTGKRADRGFSIIAFC